MNHRHSGVTNWGLSHVRIEKTFTALDVGCGGGRTIQSLSMLASEGKVFGIDYSATSVAASRATNAQLIEAGRVDIQQGTVSHMPYPDRSFDIVSAVETHYYWPSPVSDLQAIRRVLKPGGQVVIIAERYNGRQFDLPFRLSMKLLRATYLTASEHRDLLATAGYTDVEVFEEPAKGWICAIGRAR
jgi:SAM-dependent methyltransferase